MLSKDHAAIKVLVDLNLINQPDLSSEQEDILARALDVDLAHLYDIEQLFINNPAAPEKL